MLLTTLIQFSSSSTLFHHLRHFSWKSKVKCVTSNTPSMFYHEEEYSAVYLYSTIASYETPRHYKLLTQPLLTLAQMSAHSRPTIRRAASERPVTSCILSSVSCSEQH